MDRDSTATIDYSALTMIQQEERIEAELELSVRPVMIDNDGNDR